MSTMNKAADSNESGQELVEGAFVLLMLSLLLFGVFEVGRVIQTRQALTDAAREGARSSISPLTQSTQLAQPSDVKDVVKQYLSAAHITVPDSDITVEQNYTIGGGPTEYTRVTVRYAYPIITTKILGLNNVNLVGSSMMRNETSP